MTGLRGLAGLESGKCQYHGVARFGETIERSRGVKLTFCLLLVLPICTDFADEDDVRGWGPPPGDIERAGTVGGSPGSATGDRR